MPLRSLIAHVSIDYFLEVQPNWALAANRQDRTNKFYDYEHAAQACENSKDSSSFFFLWIAVRLL